MSIENIIKNNVVLAPLTTFKIGGSAEFFAEINDETELIDLINWAGEKNMPYRIFSGGSNILVSDQKINGLAIRYKAVRAALNKNELICAAGTILAQAANLARNSQLSGLEWAIGIPGSIGGAIFGNAGAYGQDLAGIVKLVRVYDTIGKKIIELDNRQCVFGYKDSIFKHQNNLIITEVTIKLSQGVDKNITDLMKLYQNKRQSGQPGMPSAGCVFKNIFVGHDFKDDKKLSARIDEKAVKNGKISAGWLIDQLNLKEKRIGGAQISKDHANFIINVDQATAEDVITLIRLVKRQVLDNFGFELQEEIQYFGF